MGEGFVVMQSNDVDIYYYQDEPGKLTHTHAHSSVLMRILLTQTRTHSVSYVRTQNAKMLHSWA